MEIKHPSSSTHYVDFEEIETVEDENLAEIIWFEIFDDTPPVKELLTWLNFNS